MGKLRILVRSSKDASAVRHAIRSIMRDEYVTVEHLSGARGERLCRALREKVTPFTIILLDRSSPIHCETPSMPFVEVVRAEASKIRNMPLQKIASLITLGRAGLRLHYSWTGESIVLSPNMGEPLVGLEVSREGDSFILYREGLKVLHEILNLDPPLPGSAGLLVKLGEGAHIIYESIEPLAKLRFERGKFGPTIQWVNERPSMWLRLDRLVESNRSILRVLEEFSQAILARAPTHRVIVPLSGGKDSAVALVLAVEAFGPENVVAIHVDTGIDFPENREYAEYLASKLGVELIVARADVDKGLLAEGMPLPHPKNRWCTARKLDALRTTVKRLAEKGFATVIVGDRDAESGKRSMRPPVRVDDKLGLPVVAPLKYWSGAHVEAFLLSKGLKMNPLYEIGFVRTGCYLCFALRPSWELFLLMRIGYYSRLSRARPEQEKLILRFLSTSIGGDARGGLRGEVKTNN